MSQRLEEPTDENVLHAVGPPLGPHGAAFVTGDAYTDKQRRLIANYLSACKEKLYADKSKASKNSRPMAKANAKATPKPTPKPKPTLTLGVGGAEPEPESDHYAETGHVPDYNLIVAGGDYHGPSEHEVKAWRDRLAMCAADCIVPPPPRADPSASRFLDTRRRVKPTLDMDKVMGTERDIDDMERVLEETEGTKKTNRKPYKVDPSGIGVGFSREVCVFGGMVVALVVPGGGPKCNATQVSSQRCRHADSHHYCKVEKHTGCRRNLHMGSLEDLPRVVPRLKQWAILGYRWKCNCPEITGDKGCGETRCAASQKHMALSFRVPEAAEVKPSRREITSLVKAGIFGVKEVQELIDDIDEQHGSPGPSAA